MILRNFTPFPHLVFESRDAQRRDFGVVVLRGTFAIVPDVSLVCLPAQEPIVVADQYFGEPGLSSLHVENNLAPFKPRSDIHINAIAHAPGRQARTSWQVGVEFGKLKKTIGVTGPRYWRKVSQDWHLLEPIPVVEVPIHYERAFGGTRRVGPVSDVFDRNPVGLGLASAAQLEGDQPIPAPCILPDNHYYPKINEPIPVQGLGPIPPAWQPRLGYAGTFDAHWEDSRWPDLPEDFRFDFYNSAHPDLIYPGFLEGDEQVHLSNLTPAGSIRFALPDYLLGMLLRFADGQMLPAPMRLDTVHLEIPAMKAFLTWRGIYPVDRPLRVLEARMRTGASLLRARQERID